MDDELLKASHKPPKAITLKIFNHIKNKDFQFVSHTQIFHYMNPIFHTMKINLFWEITVTIFIIPILIMIILLIIINVIIVIIIVVIVIIVIVIIIIITNLELVNIEGNLTLSKMISNTF